MQVWHGQEGLDVYEEIHQNYYNELVHVIFLPGVFYGTFRGIPALLHLCTGIEYHKTTILSIMMLYSTYYGITLDIQSGLTAFLTISPYGLLACEHLYTKTNHIQQSMLSLISCLTIQEIFGHALFEEVYSRLTVDYIFNAIMFSPLYYALNVHKILLLLQFYVTFFLF